MFSLTSPKAKADVMPGHNVCARLLVVVLMYSDCCQQVIYDKFDRKHIEHIISDIYVIGLLHLKLNV